VLIWDWDADGASGVGQVAAEARLLRQLPGARMEMREVRIALGTDLEPFYQPTGRTLSGVHEADGSVTWT